MHGQVLCERGPAYAYAYLFLNSCVRGFKLASAPLVLAYTDTGLHAHVASQEPSFKSRFICFLSKCKFDSLFYPFAYFAPFSGKGSTNRVAAWYWVLIAETRAHICVVDFEPIIHLLPKGSTSAILVKTLAERWWHTTHTLHFANREMNMTPYDFHHMTNLWCDVALINLESELGT